MSNWLNTKYYTNLTYYTSIAAAGLFGFFLGNRNDAYIPPQIPNQLINSGFLTEEYGKKYILIEKSIGQDEVLFGENGVDFKNLVDVTENQNLELMRKLQQNKFNKNTTN